MKTILITGGSDGLGFAIARRLSAKQKVFIVARNQKKLAKTAEELQCDYEVCDVGSYQDCHTAVENIVEKTKRIDCLINNAGINISGPLDECDPKTIEDTLRTNTLGTIFMTKAVLSCMKAQKTGLIININSQGGLMPGKPETSVYHASKWGVTGFTKTIQPELAEYGIRVTGFYPGLMQTNIFTKSGVNKDTSSGLDLVEVAKAIEFVVDSDEVFIPELGIKRPKK